ncbi:DUF2612 domain-containing protein [Gracilibacillus oryzae]|uniref:DUF2612 domain-containing protein n=1 Tax=Gracilibacillus oryzae TaxID=1672701 RepID=A0A7C8GVP1_9BACI|nr:hypothetical protein [Gracilibacillus oryzae]KAB8139256.1 DUF2612 domain-containing protein [Gracilibacillus oryzae]
MIMIKKITDRYTQNPNSNIGKLISIFEEELQEFQVTNGKIKHYQDIDNAVGKVLDNYGNEVGQPRYGADDDLYRLLIKTKDKANFSEGDIETINEIMSIVMGNDYIGLKESWTSNVYDHEPAAIELYLSENASMIPSPWINRVVQDGVRIYWMIKAERESLVLTSRDYSFDIPYKICNTFQTAGMPGGLSRSPLDIQENAYGFDVYYPICNTFNTSQISVEEEQINVMLTEEYRNNDVLYKRAGEVYVGEGEI